MTVLRKDGGLDQFDSVCISSIAMLVTRLQAGVRVAGVYDMAKEWNKTNPNAGADAGTECRFGMF